MITEEEQKQLRQLFGGHYSQDVLNILNHQNITNRNGEPHSSQYVRMVFQGVRQNAEIEKAIWQLADKRKYGLEWHEIRKKRLFYNIN